MAAPKPSELFSVSPVLLRPQLAYLLSQFQYFVCPVGFNGETNRFMVECEPSDIFVMQEYTLPVVFLKTLGLVRIQRPLHQEMFVETLTFRKAADLHFCFCTASFVHLGTGKTQQITFKKYSALFPFQEKVNMYPFQIHSIFLSSFASLIGPFGGFFASGFKRAFKIKVI